MTAPERDCRYELSFEMTAEGILEASKLLQRRQYLLVGAAGVAELAASVLMFVFGSDPVLASLVGLFGLLSLAFTQMPAILRWRIRRLARSVLGTTAKVEIDSTGFTFSNEQSSGHVEWSGLTAVRESDKIVLVMRDRLPYAWLPASAFGSPERRDEIVSFMRAQIAAAREVAPRP